MKYNHQKWRLNLVAIGEVLAMAEAWLDIVYILLVIVCGRLVKRGVKNQFAPEGCFDTVSESRTVSISIRSGASYICFIQ